MSQTPHKPDRSKRYRTLPNSLRYHKPTHTGSWRIAIPSYLLNSASSASRPRTRAKRNTRGATGRAQLGGESRPEAVGAGEHSSW
jgi:hypothetical protein